MSPYSWPPGTRVEAAGGIRRTIPRVGSKGNQENADDQDGAQDEGHDHGSFFEPRIIRGQGLELTEKQESMVQEIHTGPRNYDAAGS